MSDHATGIEAVPGARTELARLLKSGIATGMK